MRDELTALRTSLGTIREGVESQTGKTRPCKLCGRPLLDTLGGKADHAKEFHPDLYKKAGPMAGGLRVLDPGATKARIKHHLRVIFPPKPEAMNRAARRRVLKAERKMADRKGGL